jgi:hypothetical protein
VRRQQHLTGINTIPSPAQLYDGKILKWQFVAFLLFIINFSAGLVLQLKLLIYLGVICLAVTAVLYVGNVFIILLGKQKT